MRLVFAGTPEFAATALDALSQAGHDIALVLTQPDRPHGRGLHEAPSAVKRRAEALGLPLAQPETLKDGATLAQLAAAGADAMVVAAYGLILPRAVLEIPRLGCLNIHASLLPRWRGAAPIQRALLAGDRETGISIMQMDAGLDTGPVLLREATPISADDTAETLHDRLAALGARAIVRTLAEPCQPEPQDGAQATYAAKIDKREARIDWHETAEAIDRKIRAFSPVPGASTVFGGAPLKIWRAAVERGVSGEPQRVLRADARGIVVACADAALRITELQRAGGKRVSAQAFLSGSQLRAGDRLGEAA
jgi:methionyl-tRNA formyltransferase